MEFPTVSLVDVASYLPENRVPTEYFTQFARSERMAKNVMFRSPKDRHHVARDETAVDMVERAVAPLIERHGADTDRQRGRAADPHPAPGQSRCWAAGPRWRGGSGCVRTG